VSQEAPPPEGHDSAAASDGSDEALTNGEGLDDKRMSLLEHLQELRKRLRNAAIAFMAAMILSFVFVKRFFQILVGPTVEGIRQATGDPIVKLQVTNPTEGFWVMMKLAVLGGFLVAAPFVFWELWKFVAPGLYKKERHLALVVTASTALCFAGGALFGYFVLSKPAAYFLTTMAMEFGAGASAGGTGFQVDTPYRMEPVVDFLIFTLAGCGAAFELPVVLVILGALGIISARGMFRFSKYALILSAVAGAVLTPSTDPFTQILLAGPLYVLYNLSILFVWLIERARRKREAALDAGLVD
jgi:sec-independent protein translocase protein TatC